MIVLSSESGCGRVSLMLIYSLLCVLVSRRLNNSEAAGFPGGQLEEVTDPADVSDSDRPALDVYGFGQVQFYNRHRLEDLEPW